MTLASPPSASYLTPVAPEFDNAVKPRAFREIWDKMGVAKIAGFLSPSDTAEFRQTVDNAYTLIAQELDRDAEAMDATFVSHFRQWHGVWLSALRPLLRQVAPAMDCQIGTMSAEIEHRFARLFGARWWPLPERSFFRRHNDSSTYVPWHIDAEAARTIVFGRDCVNIWLPLDQVGGHSPSLEFVLGSHRYMHRVPLAEEAEAYRSDEWVDANGSGHRWAPMACPGDAILFGHWTLHRTQHAPTARQQRTSCEFRFVRPNLPYRLRALRRRLKEVR